MRSVVVIPAWRRPEMLAVCLKYARKAQGFNDLPFLVQVDEGYDPDVFTVTNRLTGLLSCTIGLPHTKIGRGNSHNIFVGLMRILHRAEQIQADYIHLLEEDVWVGKDYFDAHEQIHKQFLPWAVSLCRNQHRRVDPVQDPTLVYKSHDYQSIGVSFPLDSVREILVHNTDEYLNDMSGYIKMMFPNSKYGGLYPEQDGLIQRIIEKNNYDVVYSNVPRAHHAGYYSYHRAGKEPEGTLEEKIAQLENMTEAEMNERSTYKDIRFCNLQGYDVKEFALDDRS